MLELFFFTCININGNYSFTRKVKLTVALYFVCNSDKVISEPKGSSRLACYEVADQLLYNWWLYGIHIMWCVATMRGRSAYGNTFLIIVALQLKKISRQGLACGNARAPNMSDWDYELILAWNPKKMTIWKQSVKE